MSPAETTTILRQLHDWLKGGTQWAPTRGAEAVEAGTVIEALGMNQSRRFDTALYLAPGAQPAPSEQPEAFLAYLCIRLMKELTPLGS